MHEISEAREMMRAQDPKYVGRRSLTFYEMQVAVQRMSLEEAVYSLGLTGPTGMALMGFDGWEAYMRALREDPRMEMLLAIAQGDDDASKTLLRSTVLKACRTYIEDFPLPEGERVEIGTASVAAFDTAVSGWALLLDELEVPPAQTMDVLWRINRRAQHAKVVRKNIDRGDPDRAEPAPKDWTGCSELSACAQGCWLCFQRYGKDAQLGKSVTAAQAKILARFSDLDAAMRQRVSEGLATIPEESRQDLSEVVQPWITPLSFREERAVVLLAEEFMRATEDRSG